MSNVVSLVRVGSSSLEDIKKTVSKAIDLIQFKPDGPVESVIVKPNLCYYWNSATGYTTDPRVVTGIIDWIRERYGDNVCIRIAEADASAMRTKHAFPILGYEKLAKEKNVELLNLSEDVLVDRTVSVNNHEMSFRVPKLVLESDLFVNVPKMKIMRTTKITCAMKNVFGCIGSPRKIVYHPFLDEAIVGINRILRPHLTIVDGLIALGRFPVELGLVACGADPFAVDWIASQVMGYRPSRVKFLEIAAKEKLGNPDDIAVRGESIEEFREIFPRADFTSSNYCWGIQFWLLNAYRRIVGDVIPPFLEEA